MNWVFYTKIVAGIITIIVVTMLLKELIGSIKRSKDGEVSKKWDID